MAAKHGESAGNGSAITIICRNDGMFSPMAARNNDGMVIMKIWPK
jgi:hypothetical protein